MSVALSPFPSACVSGAAGRVERRFQKPWRRPPLLHCTGRRQHKRAMRRTLLWWIVVCQGQQASDGSATGCLNSSGLRESATLSVTSSADLGFRLCFAKRALVASRDDDMMRACSVATRATRAGSRTHSAAQADLCRDARSCLSTQQTSERVAHCPAKLGYPDLRDRPARQCKAHRAPFGSARRGDLSAVGIAA